MKETDFESVASTNSATEALLGVSVKQAWRQPSMPGNIKSRLSGNRRLVEIEVAVEITAGARLWR